MMVHRIAPSTLRIVVLTAAAVLVACRNQPFDIIVQTTDGLEATEATLTFSDFSFVFGHVGSARTKYGQCEARFPRTVHLSWRDASGQRYEREIAIPQDLPSKAHEDRYELILEINGADATARIAVDDIPSKLRG